MTLMLRGNVGDRIIIYCVPDASPITAIYAMSVTRRLSVILACHETYCRL